MQTELLYTLIQVLFMILVSLWITIGASVFYRKRRTAHLQIIESTFADITAAYLYPLPGEKPDLIQIQRAFRKIGIKNARSANVQYLQDLMIRTQASMLGENYHKLEVLYSQIPPYRASLNKLGSRDWYIKARGIREIYEMDQKQYIRDVLRERNNKNIYVRREAQIALVVFLGWDSLRFLPYLKREMTLWQQIKIVEKLFDLHPEPDLQKLRRTYLSEKKYAHELIMRIIRKFRLESEIEFIIQFLDDVSFDTRESAIYCISSFRPDGERQQIIKKKFFSIPNTEQQIQLLKYISTAFTIDLQFYKELLYSGNDIIQLKAAEILWTNGFIEEVQQFYLQQYTSNQPEKETAAIYG